MQMSLLQRSESENEKKVATDEELNEIIARNQNEYELFQEIDKKREEEETSMWMNKTGGSGQKPDRLMSANELPSWLQSENYQPPDELIYGRGRRTRPDINYDDSVEEAGKVCFLPFATCTILLRDFAGKEQKEKKQKPI